MAEKGERIVAKDGVQGMGRIICMAERQRWKWWKGSQISDVISEMYKERLSTRM